MYDKKEIQFFFKTYNMMDIARVKESYRRMHNHLGNAYMNQDQHYFIRLKVYCHYEVKYKKNLRCSIV